VGIIFLSTPYDEESADLLEELNIPCFKIASTDANNIPFLQYVARKNHPIILSTAMCTLEEVRESVKSIQDEGCKDLILLHCTANYPAMLKDTNLRAMLTIKKKFNTLVGYSDHAPDNINPIAATALGAVVYEKHFTLDKNLPGPDHRSSLSPEELRQFVQDIRQTELALGSATKEPAESERENRKKLRKSVVTKADILPGTVITREMLATKRPGTGLALRYMNAIIGKRTNTLIKKDSVIQLEHFE
jgi:sialic acid synthase SpsE